MSLSSHSSASQSFYVPAQSLRLQANARAISARPLHHVAQTCKSLGGLPAGLTAAMASVGARCLWLPGFACREDDRRLKEILLAECHAQGNDFTLHRNQKHWVVMGEHLTGSEVFTLLVSGLLYAFDLTLVDCHVNVYGHGGERKPWHRDYYERRSPRPQATIGLSLGATRTLGVQRISTGAEYFLPLANGDAYAFDDRFNNSFKHCIPSARDEKEPRLSLIIFGVELGPGMVSVPHVTRLFPSQVPGEEPTAKRVSWANWNIQGMQSIGTSGMNYEVATDISRKDLLTPWMSCTKQRDEHSHSLACDASAAKLPQASSPTRNAMCCIDALEVEVFIGLLQRLQTLAHG